MQMRASGAHWAIIFASRCSHCATGVLTTSVEARTVAITPFKARSYDFAEVKRVCQDCTLAGLKAMYDAGPARPFRVVYFSAEGVPRDETQKPFFLGEYRAMRVSAGDWPRRRLM